MIEAALAFLSTKLGLATLAGGTLAATLLGPRIVRPLVKKYVARELAKVLNPATANAHRRELIRNFALAAVRLAEDAIPDRGQGASRKALVARMLGKALPKAQADAISELIEEAVVTMDEELKKAGQ